MPLDYPLAHVQRSRAAHKVVFFVLRAFYIICSPQFDGAYRMSLSSKGLDLV